MRSRLTLASTSLRAYLEGDGTVRLQGATAHTAAFTHSITSTYRLRVKAVGGSLSVSVDGTP